MFEVITNFSLMIPISHERDVKGLLKSLHVTNRTLIFPFTSIKKIFGGNQAILFQGLKSSR